MAGSGGGPRRPISSFGSRPIALQAPHPPRECLQRLAAVTTQRSAFSWRMDPANDRRADPLLGGTLGPAWISVARFEDTAGRNSFAPWLRARLESNGEGTTLTGTVGLAPAVARLLPALIAAGGLIFACLLVAGIALLARGHLNGLPFVLGPLALAGFFALIITAGLRSLDRHVPLLIEDVNEILGSTALP
jgi:hypothetical protein